MLTPRKVRFTRQFERQHMAYKIVCKNKLLHAGIILPMIEKYQRFLTIFAYIFACNTHFLCLLFLFQNYWITVQTRTTPKQRV